MADSNFCQLWNALNISFLSLSTTVVVVVALCLHLNVQIHLRLFSTFFLGDCECTKRFEIERN